MNLSRSHIIRHEKTLKFVNKHLTKGSTILDLGTENLLSKKLSQNGYLVENTKGEDLDINFQNYCFDFNIKSMKFMEIELDNLAVKFIKSSTNFILINLSDKDKLSAKNAVSFASLSLNG